ncbi:MAG TPA: alpha/beta fold hydrolase [Burkholderiales bacterium]|nr:alpha/beta fold hydrolase [Burkholderiales bacterium]
MKLEILSEPPEQPARQTPLLFIHGAYVAAWCWAENFLPYFARRGYAAHAVSLRGHGASEGREDLYLHSLGDYVRDVRRVVDSLDREPVLVGHSMGGMVVQRYLERYTAPGAVLMSSVPPTGLLGPGLSLAQGDPALFHEMGVLQYGNPRAASLDGLRRALFSPRTPDHIVLKALRMGQRESYRAIFDMTWPQLRLNGRHRLPPVLVLGGEEDAFFGPDALRATAGHFGVEPEIFPHMAHALMLEPGWEAVADRILAWLARHGL